MEIQVLNSPPHEIQQNSQKNKIESTLILGLPQLLKDENLNLRASLTECVCLVASKISRFVCLWLLSVGISQEQGMCKYPLDYYQTGVEDQIRNCSNSDGNGRAHNREFTLHSTRMCTEGWKSSWWWHF